MINRVGQQLGNYRIIRLLGEGGFAEVYLGEHIHLGTQAAIKVLHAQLMSEDIDKFRSESRNLASLVHPHIVRVLDFGLEGKTPFLVMDFASNGTLRQHYPTGTRLSTTSIVSYVSQIASGLQYAHNKKLIHRDIKPENMLLGQNNEVLLSDFGIAVISQSSHSQSMQEVIGTVSYMAPEQFQGKPRLASDQYALAIVVYEWLSGSRPFHGNFVEVASQHMFAPVPSLREKDATIPSAVEGVVLKALAKDPAQRFTSVEEFANSLVTACQPNRAPDRPKLPPTSPQPTLSPPFVAMPPTRTVTPPSVNTPQIASYTPSASTEFSSQPFAGPHSKDTTSSPYRGQFTGVREGPQPKKNPNFAIIIGTAFLLLILVGGGIFFFSRGTFSPGTTANTNGNSNTGSSSGGTSNSVVNGKNCTKVGILLPETATSVRWDSVDKPDLIKDITAALPAGSPAPDYNNADGSASLQQAQAQADLAKGDCILVVAAYDSTAAAAIVTAAKAMNVPVIAYDRLIQSRDLAYYVSFDNVKVGALQGQYIADHYQSYVSSGKLNTVMIDGAQTDYNALLFKQGAHSVLDPLFANGNLNKVYETFTPNWDNNTAQIEMEGALTATQNNVQIAYVANDGMANSVIAALKARQLNGKVLVTGQDASVAGIQHILAGDQAMTVYKALTKEAQATADLVKALYAGTDTSSLTNGATTKTADGTAIPSILATPVAVDKTNVKSTVIADGFVSLADACQGLPAGTDGICP